jgi:hypothetical protein
MDRIKFLFSEVYQFLKPFITLLMTQAGRLLIQVAYDTVIATEKYMAGEPGPEKHTTAYKTIVNQLKREGIVMAAAVVDIAIKMAVLKMQSVE